MLPTVGVLVSGRGSNLDALLECSGTAYNITSVLADRPCPAVERSRQRGLSAQVLPWPGKAEREKWSLSAVDFLMREGVDIVACAGFMRILSPVFLERLDRPVLNIHPSLLPLFRGLHPQQQALDAGVMVSGATVHYVTAELDAGPIIAQRAVPILPDDDTDLLSARILEEEHRLYPEALAQVAEGRCSLKDGKIVWQT